MDYDNTPGSPPLPAPDTEVADRLPTGDLPDEDFNFLDLNPELNSDTPPVVNGTGFIIDTEEESRRAATASPSVLYDKREEFQPTITPSPSPYSSSSSSTIHQLHHHRLSTAQQSKFINYLDSQLLQIRRRFVQSHGLNENGYTSLFEILEDLKPLINFIWLSIEPKHSPILSIEQYRQEESPLFGQVDYLISMTNDVLDYATSLEIKDAESAVQLLSLLDSLDGKFARLLDGTIPGGKPMSKTEGVRLLAIAERSRFEIVGLFEKNGVEGFHYELSKLYERVLDRTT